MTVEEFAQTIQRELHQISTEIGKLVEEIKETNKRVTDVESRVLLIERDVQQRPTLLCETFFDKRMKLALEEYTIILKQKHENIHREWKEKEKREMRENVTFYKNIYSFARDLFPSLAIIAYAIAKVLGLI